MHQQNKSSKSQVKFRQASNCCKRVHEAAKLAYANKTKDSITSEKPVSLNLRRIANSVFNKGKSARSPLFNDPEELSSPSDKANRFLKTFLRTLILMTQVFRYLVFPSITNRKLHNISVTPKMFKKVTTNLDSPKASGPDFIPVVVLKNCQP